MTAAEVSLFVPGKPVPMPRPRVTRFGTYHSKPSVVAKAAVVAAWRKAGAHRLDDRALAVSLTIMVPRPKSHLLATGGLSSAGRAAAPYPGGDLDNYLKLPLDALNGLAWGDDVQFVTATVHKAWTKTGAYGLFLVAAPASELQTATALEIACQRVTA